VQSVAANDRLATSGTNLTAKNAKRERVMRLSNDEIEQIAAAVSDAVLQRGTTKYTNHTKKNDPNDVRDPLVK
jgi:hypothetical protein